ncbi:unnamed protein product [Cochlearia groenlandica]
MHRLEDVNIRGMRFPYDDTKMLFTSISAALSLDVYLTDEMVLCVYSETKISCNLVITYQQINPVSRGRSRAHTPSACHQVLENFELIGYEGSEEEEKLVEYILKNSKCLKTATISMYCTFADDEDKDKEAIEMEEKLKAIPRASLSSQLIFDLGK